MVASRPDRWSHLHLSLRRAAAAAAAVWLWAAVPAAEGSPLDWDVAAAPAAGSVTQGESPKAGADSTSMVGSGRIGGITTSVVAAA